MNQRLRRLLSGFFRRISVHLPLRYSTLGLSYLDPRSGSLVWADRRRSILLTLYRSLLFLFLILFIAKSKTLFNNFHFPDSRSLILDK